jgi:hypothetical protein
MTWATWRRWLIALALAGTLVATLPAPGARASAASDPAPVLAYYYIWFTPSSWRHAKRDYPALGRYSSDEQTVMRQHIRWAKRAGIDGFLVSWKSTPVLNERLRKLIAVAAQEHFKLGIVYEGLDFERRPLPAHRIAADLAFLQRRYSSSPVLRILGKTTVVVTGTWKFSRSDLRIITRHARPRLQVLASSPNVADYQRVADLFDGDAYYWSSVNPQTFPGYEQKLRAMSAAVHAHQGLWIAPAAVGFDARLIGGHTVVDRQDGANLRRQFSAATASSPDAVGLISWNEFSENSYLEPSVKYGSRYLQVLARILGAKAPVATDLDSSAPDGRGSSSNLILMGGGVLLLLAALTVTGHRRRSRTKPRDPDPLPGPRSRPTERRL